MSSASRPPFLLMLRPCDHVQGDDGAGVILIEYGCYTSPDCAALHRILADLQRHFETRLRVVFRHFPQPDPTEKALHAAEAAEAAATQNRFWQMHHQLFTHQDALGDGELVEYAIALRLNVSQFLQEMRQDAHLDRIRADIESGIQLGVEQAPVLFINGQRYRAALEFDALRTAIDQVIHDSLAFE